MGRAHVSVDSTRYTRADKSRALVSDTREVRISSRAEQRDRRPGLIRDNRVYRPSTQPAIALHKGQVVGGTEYEPVAHIKVRRSVVVSQVHGIGSPRSSLCAECIA